MRTLVLAEELRGQGHRVVFVSRPQPGDLVARIRAKGFEVMELTAPQQWQTPQHNTDYNAWLQTSWQQDASDFLALVKKADWVVIDHYGIGCEWERCVRQALNCRLFAIDDLVRAHCADVLLDQTLGRKACVYDGFAPDALRLTGCDYALVSPVFAAHRQIAFEQTLRCEGLRILVTMGGVDQPNATIAVLHALEHDTTQDLKVTVLLGPNAPHYADVKAFCAEQTTWITHFDFVEEMAKAMMAHDLVIGAPGTSSWERACLGVPNIVVPLADNQSEICRALMAAQATLCVELGDISAQLTTAVADVLKEREALRDANFALCDGLGVFRVTAVMNALGCEPYAAMPAIGVRRANANDIERVYQWQCQPQTRRYAINPSIPSWEAHQSWMNHKLRQYMDYFYIIESALEESDKIPVGVIRLDRIAAGEYLVSIFLDANNYGRGIARAALALVGRIHRQMYLKATVLATNHPSQKLFESAGYKRIDLQTFMRPPISEHCLEL
jgi:UDP-2,4-diacetamido-2,4,6-trideoxy-beta-L-altropyranose hydrolase